MPSDHVKRSRDNVAAMAAKTGSGAPAGGLTATGKVLLGMIAEGHVTGYSIKAEIERSTRLYWGASIGAIYPELRRLEAAALVSSRDDYRGQTRRHAYELTKAGMEALDDWLMDGAEPLFEMRHEALLKLRFAGVLPGGEQLTIVRLMRDVHERQLAQLEARLLAGAFDDPLHRAAIEFGAGWNRWARDWCRDLEETIAARVNAGSRGTLV